MTQNQTRWLDDSCPHDYNEDGSPIFPTWMCDGCRRLAENAKPDAEALLLEALHLVAAFAVWHGCKCGERYCRVCQAKTFLARPEIADRLKGGEG